MRYIKVVPPDFDLLFPAEPEDYISHIILIFALCRWAFLFGVFTDRGSYLINTEYHHG